MQIAKKNTLILFIFLVFLNSSKALAFEYSGYVGIESLGFLHNPLDGAQHNHYLSGVAEIELYHEWDKGSQSIAFVPFYRYSQHDSRRTHFDIRELTWLKAARNWELRVGIRKVFWGVSEAQHLVDIINQTDLVENSDTEDKLGQPMINLAIIQDWGTLDLFFLTGFRERTFAGKEARLRSFPEVSVGEARYEKHGAEKHLGFAARWSHSLGDWDLGLSHFYGTNREPTLLPELQQTGELKLIPYYEMIHQSGVDIQVTKGSWLWKMESIVRSGQGRTFFASTAGFEYSLYNLFETGLDLGIVAEYLYDSRGDNSPTTTEDDFLAAVRFSFNDIQSTEILAGVILDRRSNEKFYNIEASRRLGDDFKIEVEARFFSGAASRDISYFLRNDDHIRAELSYHF
ncbi:MAG: hypothetical protein GQ569_02605 [Methylococcaceae bacterium]|nr:hypothetical protein [Methylococcaceae bacterium]